MRREFSLAVLFLSGLVAWACGDDKESAPAPTPDGGAPVDAARPPVDTGADAPGPRGKTAGTCGPTERSISFGNATTSGIFSGEDEAVSALAADTQGNLFVAGWTREGLDGGTKNKSLLVEKRDPNRTVLWRNVAGDDLSGLFQAAFTRAHGMALEANGGVVVAGIFAGTLNLGGAPLVSAKPTPDAGADSGFDAGDAGFDLPPCSLGVGDCVGDAFVARFDPSTGAHTWSVRVGGENGDGARAVAVAPDGTIFAAGHFEGSMQVGASMLVSAGKADGFVVHLDANGTVLDGFRIGGTGDDAIYGLAVDPSSGDVIVTGHFSTSMTIGTTTYTVKHDKIDGFVAKMSPTGQVRWSRQLATGRAGFLGSVTTDATGNVYVAGYADGTFEFSGFAGNSYYLEDAFVAKLDTTGGLLWSKLWGGDGEEVASSIALGPAGAVFVSGVTDAPGGVDFGGGRIGGGLVGGPFFVELTNAGEHVCSRSYAAGRGPETDATIQFVGAGSNAVVAATPTSFAAGGSFAATLDLGKGTMTSKGGYDLWIADFTR